MKVSYLVLDLVLCNTVLPIIEPGPTKIYVSVDEDVQIKCPIKCSNCSKVSLYVKITHQIVFIRNKGLRLFIGLWQVFLSVFVGLKILWIMANHQVPF